MIVGSLEVYTALFGAAFLAATILPAQSELLLAYLLRSGEHSWGLLLAMATAGNVLGSVVNWFLGRSIERLRVRRWFPVGKKALERAERWYARWGKWSLLLSWAPVAGAPDQRLELIREMAEFILPRPGMTPHRLTTEAARNMLALVDRAEHYRTNCR